MSKFTNEECLALYESVKTLQAHVDFWAAVQTRRPSSRAVKAEHETAKKKLAAAQSGMNKAFALVQREEAIAAAFAGETVEAAMGQKQ